MYPSSRVRRVVLRAVIVAAAMSGAVLWPASSALAVTPPANDNLTNATLLSTSGTYHAQSSESTVGATTESGEPFNNNLGGATVWYVWQAPDYPVNVTATTAAYTDVYGSQLQTASNFDTVLNVYQDTTGLPLVGGNDDAVGVQSLVTFSAQANTVYLFQIGGFGSVTPATGNLNFLIATQPANDNFANATTLSGVSTQTNTDGTLYGATAETGEFGGFFQPPSVWYTYTPAKDGELTASLVNTGSQTVMNLWTGSAIGSLTFVDGDTASFTRDRLTAGVTYHIEVFGPTDGFTLRWRYDPFPDNNDFANAQVISGTSGSVGGTTYGSSLQGGEPKDFTFQCCSVWYAWTAPESGWVTRSITSPNNDVSLDIYQGPDLLHLSVPGMDTAGAFHATQGQTYYFQAITAIRDTFSVSWSEAASPANDDFANAQVITKTDGSFGGINGDMRQASGEQGEPNISSTVASVWYSWTPTVNGDASLSITGPNTLALFTGSAVNSLTTVDGPASSLDFRVAKGTTYMIQVTTSMSTEQGFTLFGALDPAPANDNFADASAFDMGLGTVHDVSGTLAHASSEQGEPNADGQLTDWYSWTPSLSGASDIEVVSGTAQVAVYTGPDLADLNQVVGPTDSAQWSASAGQQYWIQVAMPGPPGTAFDLQTREAESDLHTTTTGPASGSVGAQLTYSSTVTNSGPQPTLVRIDLTPSFPVRLNSFTSAASCGATSNGALACVKELTPGASFSVKYRIGAPVAGTLTVTGVASSVDGYADPTPGNNTSSASTLVKTVSTTRYTGVTDDGFTAAALNIGAVGNTVFWNNLGPSANEVQDASGLGLFDLHLGAPVDFGSFQYWASGTYLVQSPPDDTTQTITVPLKHSPATGGVSTTFVLTWAAFQAPTGYQYELDIKRPTNPTLWQDWETTGLKSGSFTPDRGTGTYQFRMRLFKPGTLLASGWVTTSIKVS